MSTKRPKNTVRETERHLNTRLLPLWVGVFAILYALTGYRGWLVFFLGTAGAWLLAVLWVRSLERGLSIERKIHLAWATVGDSLHEQLKVINKSWLPAIWVEIVDTSVTLATPIRLVSDVAPHASRTRHPSHLCRRRGLYTLGPTRLRTGDPFGIYTLTLHDQHSSTVLVTPPLVPLTQLRISPGGWAGDQRRRRGALERDISDAGVRNYVPGDSLRRIHWHASAHYDTLIVRQLEAATSGDWWIFVDLDAAAQAGTGQDSTLELSIVLAASLAMRGLKERRRVGLALAGPKLVWLDPHADPAHRWRILRALSMAEAGKRSLANLMALGQPAQTATLIAITPTSDPAWVAAAGRRRRGGNMTALLVDPTDFGSPVDQGRVIAALAYSGIPYNRMPGALLEEAYASLGRSSRRRLNGIETGKRYLKQERATWQSMD
ncbi:MAG: DUF58 domain-containing protein [Anaerolineae bacterium]